MKLNLVKYYCIFLLLGVYSLGLSGQNVYKTPSGKKYHLASCRMVENVSRKLLSKSSITAYKLQPCKICKPPVKSGLQFGSSPINKGVGQSVSVRCKGKTQKGTLCKHMTRIANGYCYQHTSQHGANRSSTNSYKPSTVTPTCGARTQSGGHCKRKVKGGGRCYQH
jgi:hypothetical protein